MAPTRKRTLREGFTKRTLPMLPLVPAMTRIPLEANNATSPKVDDRVEKIFAIVTEYNQHPCFTGQPDALEGSKMSEEVPAITREINEIGVQAQKDTEAQVGRLRRAVRDFAWQMRKGELDLGNPTWSRTLSNVCD